MPTRRTASLKSLLALRASVGVEMVTEKIKHLRRSASPRTPRLRLQLARVYWRPVPSAHRLPSRPGLTKELVISQSCAVLSGTALCPEGLLEAVLCGYAFRYCTLSGRLRAQRVPVGEGRAAVADSGRARAKTGSVSMCIVFPVCDHPILSLVS